MEHEGDLTGRRQKTVTGPFTSTRNPTINATFQEAILSGYAPDGGLFVPRNLPRWSREDLVAMQSLSYSQLAHHVLRSLVPREEVTDGDLHKVLAAAYSNFDPEKVVVVKQLPSGVYVSELFHGPTQCFKDLGLGVVVAFLSHFTPPEKKTRRTLVVSTTGDTGPAAVHAVVSAANPSLNILLTYPKGQISEYQRKQMTTVESPHVKVVEFEGGGDDLDVCIKAMATDSAFKDSYGLCGVNSFNIGRPLAQTVHYVWTVLRVAELEQRRRRRGSDDLPTHGDENVLLDPLFRVNVAIPTGAMGNIAACFMAKLSGLPLHHMCAGTNANDVTFRVFSRGDFAVQPAMHKTLSDAINIMCPYNMERLLYYLTKGDSPLLSSWYRELEASGKVALPSEWVSELRDKGFLAARVDDAAMLAEMARLKGEEGGYVACPHSAVGFAAARATGLVFQRPPSAPAAAAAAASSSSPSAFKEGPSPNTAQAGGGTHVQAAPAPSLGAAAAATVVGSGDGGGATWPTPCCVMATASACKFQESVTKGLGEDGWADFQSSPLYPASAHKILAMAEVPPVVFEATEGKSLAENQQAWEQRMREIIMRFAEN